MGDRPGHPFRGNQWGKGGRGGGGGGANAVGTWTKDGDFIMKDTPEARAWQKRPGVAPGDVPAPFPVADQGVWSGHRKIDASNPAAGARQVVAGGMVPVEGLIATQHVVTAKDVKEAIPRLRAEMKSKQFTRRPATVVRIKGKNYIYNGHHRAAASKVGGIPYIHADLWEVD